MDTAFDIRDLMKLEEERIRRCLENGEPEPSIELGESAPPFEWSEEDQEFIDMLRSSDWEMDGEEYDDHIEALKQERHRNRRRLMLVGLISFIIGVAATNFIYWLS